MNAEEKDAAMSKLVDANIVFRDLRESVDEAAEAARDRGATGLAFAAYQLSEAIRAYAREMTRFIMSEVYGG